MNVQTNEWAIEQTCKWMNEWGNEPTTKGANLKNRTNWWYSEWNETNNKWIVQWTNEWKLNDRAPEIAIKRIYAPADEQKTTLTNVSIL